MEYVHQFDFKILLLLCYCYFLPLGFDLFLLEGFPSIGGLFPKRYTRLQNWPQGKQNELEVEVVYGGA